MQCVKNKYIFSAFTATAQRDALSGPSHTREKQVWCTREVESDFVVSCFIDKINCSPNYIVKAELTIIDIGTNLQCEKFAPDFHGLPRRNITSDMLKAPLRISL